ncbi:MAG: site-specific DNA-methyltransferase [Acetobacteraceae bacterium]|nr:site-specific DNA-methyltransferase [Acetobacteraceae bacterium]
MLARCPSPLLIYSKGEHGGEWFSDVARSDTNDNDKARHHWGQSESGMRDLVAKFVKPGDVVLDPFMGGGTTLAVALALGAYVIGYDIDEAAVETTKLRLEEREGPDLPRAAGDMFEAAAP